MTILRKPTMKIKLLILSSLCSLSSLSFSQDSNDIEEWFGIVKLKDSTDWYTTEFRSSYNAIKNVW